MKNVLYLCLLLTFPLYSFADASYNSETNNVSLSTEILSDGDSGFITIYSEKHIELKVFGLRDGELASLCSKEPSLGALVFLDGKMKIGVTTPNVTSTESFTVESKDDQALKDAGYVFSYVFKGDDALDMMDLLYEYSQVGFAISNSNCKGGPEAVLTVNFKTRGIDRAMRRLK